MKRREFLEAGALTAPASLAAGCANRKTVAACAGAPKKGTEWATGLADSGR
jgi:hypothetical protein